MSLFSNFKGRLKKDAKNIMWVEYWVSQVNPDNKYAAIQQEKQKDGTWLCEVELPLIMKTIRFKAEKLVDAVIGCANEAALNIDSYMAHHPELTINNIYKDKPMVIIPDTDDEDYTITEYDDEYEKHFQDNEDLMSKIKRDLMSLVEAYKKTRSTTKKFFIHVVDKRHFGENISNQELMDRASKYIYKYHNLHPMNTYITMLDESVVMFGFPPFGSD